ncbi:PREDICTED: protein KBP homolog [Papilio xuthus]|uniref:KIF-binding protein n=1 Tax=Papilio xuthus TaxID=66420 RepID=A0A194QAU1_PAPXU|nr:PREDICTED: protein KBP homolog [Papilio xuthus]KPJ00541.1 Protein KBP-like [Papilio xuthus]
MEVLGRISSTFENIKNTIKNRNLSEGLLNLKKDIQILNKELVMFGKENHDQYVRSLAMEGYITLLSVKTMPITLSDKKNILQESFDKLKPFALREECLFITLRIQNLLCYYLIQLDEVSLAKEILESMEDVYEKISKSLSENLYDAEDLFTTEPITKIKRVKPEKIDKIITNNVQMQAFLYNKLNLPEKYTLYNHTALRRQLDMKEGTPQDWALRTARLGNYFTYLNQLGKARYHLSAAYHVLRTCHDNCKLIPEEFVLQKADFEMHFLELSHHWVKYGLTLFKLSRKKILNRYFSNPTTKSNLWKTVNQNDLEERVVNVEKYEDDDVKDVVEKKGKGDGAAEKLYIFPSLNLKDIENRVPVEMICDIEEARKLFTFTHKWLMRARHFYDFEHHSAQYVSCSLQLAELYEHLAFFEKNIDNQYNIQKRRADVLEALNSLLKNCDSVMSVQIDVIKELSQVQLELMALNLQKLWREESQTNIFNLDADADSIINSLDSESNKTLTEKTLNTSSKNLFLRKMEAATLINGKLFRLSGQLDAKTPSQLSFATDILKN